MYPEVVNEMSKKWTKILIENGICEEHGLDPKYFGSSVEKVMSPLFLKQFIETGDCVLSFEKDEDFMPILSTIIAECILMKLKDSGLVDSIENENGEEVFFLTKDGKEVAEKHKNDL